MNRKGVDYAVWLALITVVAVVFLYVQLQGQFDAFTLRVGESQVALLNAYQDGETALLHVDVSSRYALVNALYALAAGPGGCGSSDGYPLWSADGISCVPDLYARLSELVNGEMDRYLAGLDAAKKPADNYKFLFDGTVVRGVALAPFELYVVPPPERKTTHFWFFPVAEQLYAKAVIGKYAVRPSFTTSIGYDFDALARLRAFVPHALACEAASEVERCVEQAVADSGLPTLQLKDVKGRMYRFQLSQQRLAYAPGKLVFGFALEIG